jgi:mRNA interferase MazF
VVAALQGDDVVLCQITSRTTSDAYSIPLENEDFISGGLRQSSRVRPNRLFTADTAIILYQVGRISQAKLQETVGRVIAILTAA